MTGDVTSQRKAKFFSTNIANKLLTYSVLLTGKFVLAGYGDLRRVPGIPESECYFDYLCFFISRFS